MGSTFKNQAVFFLDCLTFQDVTGRLFRNVSNYQRCKTPQKNEDVATGSFLKHEIDKFEMLMLAEIHPV
jgi:hypothetical protein